MSAYMVDDKKLSEIASRIIIDTEKEKGYFECWMPRLMAVKKSEPTKEGYNKLGLVLRIENELALDSRYGDAYTSVESPVIPTGHCYVKSLDVSIDCLSEYLYQISEGDFRSNQIYQELKHFEYHLLKEFYRKHSKLR